MSQESFKKKPLIGVGVIAMKRGKVLLGKRKEAHGLGDWSFPGGHLEFRETVEACAKRELEEETGLKTLYSKLGPWTEDVIENDKHYITLFVFAHFGDEPQLLEPHKCEGWEWFSWRELPMPLFLPIRSLIEKVGLEDLESISDEAMRLLDADATILEYDRI